MASRYFVYTNVLNLTYKDFSFIFKRSSKCDDHIVCPHISRNMTQQQRWRKKWKKPNRSSTFSLIHYIVNGFFLVYNNNDMKNEIKSELDSFSRRHQLIGFSQKRIDLLFAHTIYLVFNLEHESKNCQLNCFSASLQWVSDNCPFIIQNNVRIEKKNIDTPSSVQLASYQAYKLTIL